MSAANHTPGPWHADGGAAHILGQSSRAIRTHCANYPTVAYVAGYDDENGEANARLIAAAPDLLAALKALDDCYCQVNDSLTRDERINHRKVLLAARQAIAKATGVI